MSDTVIFSVGIVVFALTVWGTVMAGGYWLGEVARFEDDQAATDASSPPPPKAPPQ